MRIVAIQAFSVTSVLKAMPCKGCVRTPEFGKAEGRTADPSAPVGMTILFGNARYGFQDELSDQAFGKTKMEARLGRRDSTQARCSDGGSGIDMKFLWENRRKYAHESQGDALPEARFLSFTADQAGANDGE